MASATMTTAEQLDSLMNTVAEAQADMSKLTQEHVDRMFEACALAANQARVRLAKMTVEESGMGIMEDKVIKNHFASEVVYNAYKHEKTCGVIEEDQVSGFVRYAEPVGLLAAAIPCTNPTSTAIFKCLLALKTRNTIVISPHPRTARCTIEAARIIRDAACALGAPANWIGWIEQPTPELCGIMMKHERVQMIVATGAGGLVKAAYSSGKPAMGGGSGNTPVLIDETADIPMAVNSVLLSKTFDNGMICASEQACVVVESVADTVKEEFIRRGAYFLEGDEKKAVGDLILRDDSALNPAAVGQTAMKLADLAGVKCAPKGVRLLMAELSHVGPEEKLSHEKLCPCIGFFRVTDFEEGLKRASELVRYGGMGHTSVLYTDLAGPQKEERIGRFQEAMPTGRTLICCPTSQGAIGGLFNFRQHPSMTLCCGSWGHNATAESLQVKHLLNIKEVCQRRVPPVFNFPARMGGELHKEIAKLPSYFMVYSERDVDVAAAVEAVKPAQSKACITSPNMDEIRRVASLISASNPSAIVAVGGTFTTSVAKLARILASHPQTDFAKVNCRFFSPAGKLGKLPASKYPLVCVPVAGCGNEQTDCAAYMDNAKYHVVIDSALRSCVNVWDPMVITMTSDVAARRSALTSLVVALEVYLALTATQEIRNKALMRCKQLYLAAVQGNVTEKTLIAKHAADVGALTIATGPSLALTVAGNLMARFKAITPETALASTFGQVLLFLAEPAPTKMGTFSGYYQPMSMDLLTVFAKDCGLDSVQKLAETMVATARDLGYQTSLKDAGVSTEDFESRLDSIADDVFESQAAICAPRYPLVRELRCLLRDSYEGRLRRLDLAASL